MPEHKHLISAHTQRTNADKYDFNEIIVVFFFNASIQVIRYQINISLTSCAKDFFSYFIVDFVHYTILHEVQRARIQFWKTIVGFKNETVCMRLNGIVAVVNARKKNETILSYTIQYIVFNVVFAYIHIDTDKITKLWPTKYWTNCNQAASYLTCTNLFWKLTVWSEYHWYFDLILNSMPVRSYYIVNAHVSAPKKYFCFLYFYRIVTIQKHKQDAFACDIWR